MKRITLIWIFLLPAFLSIAQNDLAKANLIPKPVKIISNDGVFKLTNKTVIYLKGTSPDLKQLGTYLSALLKPATAYPFKVKKTDDLDKTNAIYLVLNNKPELGIEGYHLKISKEKLVICANNPAGIFRGIQTFRQLLPAEIESKKTENAQWEVPCGMIEDKPEYEFRGAMLDVSRHFFSVEDVKRYIDLIAAYKMNILHLHLSDDQGWRIEIKSWPNLTKIGGSTQVGGGKGGFYTQKQYKEIVKYAQNRYITLIPEIDMPGHTNAALASYPELNPDNKAKKLYTGTKVGFSTLMTDKEITYQFIDDVIREISAITPGPYIHIGGDESHSTKKEDYIVFINRVQKIVKKYNKTMIGWADIAAADIEKDVIAQFWQQIPDNALKAVNKGVKIIMSPATRIYMDMQYDSLSPLGLHWA
ncbi:MAG: beta-N-acetylhexosaminidase, partial [Bacteroidales bacterium]|nr:beta-N-acetylhexosaminidase [Bacteroidales bacterium]